MARIQATPPFRLVGNCLRACSIPYGMMVPVLV